MGRWHLKQLANGSGLENAAFLDLQIQEDADGTSIAAGVVVSPQPEMELYHRLVEAIRGKCTPYHRIRADSRGTASRVHSS